MEISFVLIMSKKYIIIIIILIKSSDCSVSSSFLGHVLKNICALPILAMYYKLANMQPNLISTGLEKKFQKQSE